MTPADTRKRSAAQPVIPPATGKSGTPTPLETRPISLDKFARDWSRGVGKRKNARMTPIGALRAG